MTTAARIKARRLEIGMTGEALAKKIGVSKTTVYRYENGDIEKIPLNSLEPIAAALHTSVAYLMGWDEEKNPTPGARDGNMSEFIRLFGQLSESEQTLIIAQIKGILKSKE